MAGTYRSYQKGRPSKADKWNDWIIFFFLSQCNGFFPTTSFPPSVSVFGRFQFLHLDTTQWQHTNRVKRHARIVYELRCVASRDIGHITQTKAPAPPLRQRTTGSGPLGTSTHVHAHSEWMRSSVTCGVWNLKPPEVTRVCGNLGEERSACGDQESTVSPFQPL